VGRGGAGGMEWRQMLGLGARVVARKEKGMADSEEELAIGVVWDGWCASFCATHGKVVGCRRRLVVLRRPPLHITAISPHQPQDRQDRGRSRVRVG
jgi:hypothetical protein